MTATGASVSPRTGEREAHYIWELPVRLTHWLIAGSILVLAGTGLYIGDPFLVVPGEARSRFVMGTAKAIHFWAAVVFTCAVVARIVWMFAGNRWARWDQLIPVHADRIRRLFVVLGFYLFVHRQPPESAGHNPLAGAAYTGVFGLYLLEIATGLALWSASASIDSPLRGFAVLVPLFGGLQTARWIHHLGMWLILGFAAHHVFSAILVSVLERNGTVDSIFSGWKYLHRHTLERESRR